MQIWSSIRYFLMTVCSFYPQWISLPTHREPDLLLHTPPASADSPLSCLRHHLTSLPSPTAVQTRIEDLVRLLLHYAARHAGASHLLLGTSLTALSVSLISSIATGGGFAVSDALHEEWAPASTSTRATVEGWDGTLRVLRPLREVSAKELAFWAHAANLRVLARAPPPAAVRASVGGLTRAFVTGLDRDFPSTVSTIARTCAKLAPRGDAGARCVLCERCVCSFLRCAGR
jgi:cytoplasmic tRNA 2-thiolation protein 2